MGWGWGEVGARPEGRCLCPVSPLDGVAGPAAQPVLGEQRPARQAPIWAQLFMKAGQPWPCWESTLKRPASHPREVLVPGKLEPEGTLRLPRSFLHFGFSEVPAVEGSEGPRRCWRIDLKPSFWQEVDGDNPGSMGLIWGAFFPPPVNLI